MNSSPGTGTGPDQAPATAADPSRPDIAATLVDRLGRDQIFGPPVVQGDTTLLPVARIRAGGGGGRGGCGGCGRGEGDGGGVGLSARPLGAFRVTARGRVSWHPAVDVNRIVLGGQLAIVAIVAIGVAGGRARRSARRYRRRARQARH